MIDVKEKTVVKVLLSGGSVGHARTDVLVRDVTVIIDEPADRGGTNLGPTPTEALAASLLFDRRGASLAEEIDVPFPEMSLFVSLTTDATASQVEQLKADGRRFCPIACMLRTSGTVLQEEWKVQAQ